MPRKLVLAYVDSLRSDMLKRAVSEGRAPTFGRLIKHGVLIEDCVSSFPSVTPVASAEIVTGVAADRHWISGMNWYHRTEQRYVEYGSSLDASRAFGIFRSLHDLVYNMNMAHLNPGIETVFESLDDIDVRTASTPFLIYRGRHRHQVTLAGAVGKAIETGILKFHHGTWGPKELFYGDLYSSIETPCKSSSVPGKRDSYSACCAAELIKRDRFDFLLLSFPDNDNYSHRHGPGESVNSIERADLCMADVVRAAGGVDAFLERHALILLADHAHSEVEHPLPIIEDLAERWHVLRPSEDHPELAELAVSPTSRAADIYLLGEDPGSARHHEVRNFTDTVEGVELTCWLERDDGRALVRREPGAPGAGMMTVIQRDGERIRFRPLDEAGEAGGHTAVEVADRRGGRWLLEGDPAVIGARVIDGIFDSYDFPDGLGRVFRALSAPHAGDIMISAAPGYECLDWGKVAHVGGGSHGSLRREDSSGPLLFVGCGPESAAEKSQWALSDVAPVIREHFGAR